MDDLDIQSFRDTPVSFYDWHEKFTSPYERYIETIVHEVIAGILELRKTKDYAGSDIMRDALARCGITVGFTKEKTAVVQFDFHGYKIRQEHAEDKFRG